MRVGVGVIFVFGLGRSSRRQMTYRSAIQPYAWRGASRPARLQKTPAPMCATSEGSHVAAFFYQKFRSFFLPRSVASRVQYFSSFHGVGFFFRDCLGGGAGVKILRDFKELNSKMSNMLNLSYPSMSKS